MRERKWVGMGPQRQLVLSLLSIHHPSIQTVPCAAGEGATGPNVWHRGDGARRSPPPEPEGLMETWGLWTITGHGIEIQVSSLQFSFSLVFFSAVFLRAANTWTVL